LLLWLVLWIHCRAAGSQENTLPRYRLPVELFAVAVVAATAHLGGFLSGVNVPA